ncbi:MAG: hypothetical protein RL131_445 [Bacteroidota bacterium]
MKQTLKKHERLKSYIRIRELFEKGEKFRAGSFLVYFISREVNSPELQMGVSVGSRYFKKAVDRNLLKRRTREAYRLQKQGLIEAVEKSKKGMDVFFVFVHQEMQQYEEVFKDMKQAIDQLIKKIEHGTSR